jgi:glycine/D-amino acid oxidase-like deaminating enzyme
MSKIERVIIIGGGIIGTTLACFLSRDGRKVTLVERDALARATTAKNTGILALCSRPADHRAAMAIYGRKVYEALKTELKGAFGIDRRGSMVILPAESAGSVESIEENCRRLKALGAEAEILDGPEVKRRAPGLGVDVRAAFLDPSAAIVDAVEISRALAADAVSRGAEIREYEPVRSIITRGGRAVGVRTHKGALEADAVVVAAGVWSPFLTEALGAGTHVVPRRGQLLYTEKTDLVSRHLIQSASYVLDKTAGERADEEAMPRFRFSFTLDQHASGQCVLGTTREFAGYDERLTAEGREAMLGALRTWFPGLGKLRVVRETAGLRPWTTDHHPLVGPSSNIEGLWYATGHEGDGINLAPVTAHWIAALMAGRPLEVPNADLSLLLPGRLGL